MCLHDVLCETTEVNRFSVDRKYRARESAPLMSITGVKAGFANCALGFKYFARNLAARVTRRRANELRKYLRPSFPRESSRVPHRRYARYGGESIFSILK